MLLEKDMVFTVEPGIYVPGVGGVRIEDMHIGGAVSYTHLDVYKRQAR